MTFKEFIQKNNIRLSPGVLTVCAEGIKRMEKSRDPHHSLKHIHRMFDSLHLLIKEGAHSKKHVVDWEILLMAIIWHDVWKSFKPLRNNLLFFIYGEFYHGIGSAKMFKNYAETKLEEDIIKIIEYCIRKHASLFAIVFKKLDRKLYPPPIELMLLKDIDALDSWHEDRITDFEQAYIYNDNFDKKLVIVGKFWYHFITKRASDKDFYFDWSKKEFHKRRKPFMKGIERWWSDGKRHGWV